MRYRKIHPQAKQVICGGDEGAGGKGWVDVELIKHQRSNGTHKRSQQHYVEKSNGYYCYQAWFVAQQRNDNE